MGAASSAPIPMSEIDFESYRGIRYSKEIPNSRTHNHGPIRYYGDRVEFDLSKHDLYHQWHSAVAIEGGNRPAFGTRPIVNGKAGAYEWMTYAQANERATSISSGMTSTLHVGRQQNIGVFSKNRVEWMLVEIAVNRRAGVLVPLYDTLGVDAVPFIVNHTEMKVLFCAMDQFKTVLDCKDECPTLEIVVQFEPVTSEQVDAAKAKGLTLMSLEQLEAAGRVNHVAADPPKSTDVSTICYTSGTTGNPKGVVLSHHNLASMAVFGVQRLHTVGEDVHLSYLPLPHVFERAVMAALILDAAQIGFYQGDVLYLMDDLATLRPTLFPSVPRLFNRIYDKITQGVAAAGGLKKLLFEQGYNAKKAGLAQGYATHALWDTLVFSKVRQLLGGRIRLIVSGSAPLSAEVKDFLKIVFACEVVEGYGLSETTAGLVLASGDLPLGPHCGYPMPNTLVCLEDVPEMNYTTRDRPRPRGEVLTKGDTLFQGYYKEPDKTAEAVDKDGWFHTGDIGCWNADGTLSIIDRKKNIFKLSQGEYVAPEKVEGVYLKCKYVAQIFVYGDSLQSTLVGIVVPDPDVAEAWAKAHGRSKDDATLRKLVQDPEFRAEVLADMDAIAKAGQLRGFEAVKAVHFHYEPFTMENGLITPTFKLKRPQMKEYFKAQIDKLYGTA